MKVDFEICHNMHQDKKDDYSCIIEVIFPTEKEAVALGKLLEKFLEKKLGKTS